MSSDHAASSMSGGMGSSDPYVFHAGYAPSATGEPMQQAQVQYPQGHVKAYISTPGEGNELSVTTAKESACTKGLYFTLLCF